MPRRRSDPPRALPRRTASHRSRRVQSPLASALLASALPASALLAVLVAVPCARAVAQDTPHVYIVAIPMEQGLDAEATRAGSAARAALRQISGVEWREADQRFLGYDDSALTILDRARTHLDEGREAYLQLEFDQAIEHLSSAVDDFDAAAAALEDPNDLGQALLFLGACRAFNGQSREAQSVFRRLHAQMPHIQPDPNTFPPEVVEMYEHARPRDARNPSGLISIDSDPQGAIAYVDFLARGRTPLNVDGLMEGEHVVRVTRPGATPYVETTTVQRRRAATSNAFLVDRPNLEGLTEAVERIQDAPVDSASEGPIHEIATMLGLDKIGVIRVSSGGGGAVSLELLLYDVASGRRLVRGQGTAPVAVGELEASVQSAVTGAFEAALRPTQLGDGESIPAAMDDSQQQDDQPAPPTPLIEEWWFWTIVGVGAAALIGIAIGIGVATQGPALGQDPGGQVIFTF